MVAICCMPQGAQTAAPDNLVGWDGVGSGKEIEEGRDICITMADSCRWMAETNTIL